MEYVGWRDVGTAMRYVDTDATIRRMAAQSQNDCASVGFVLHYGLRYNNCTT